MVLAAHRDDHSNDNDNDDDNDDDNKDDGVTQIGRSASQCAA